MLDVIDLFDDQTTRDELGIGVVRDTLADLLFPGTSTIQTRARYFLFVPWIYQELERRRVPSAQIAVRSRRGETDLIEPLRASGESGIVGERSGRAVQRLPSSIYWQGLGTWGIRQFRGSQAQYHAYVDTYYRSIAIGYRNDDGELIESGATSNWHVGLPKPPNGFPASVTFALSAEEADYLSERITINVPTSLLAFLVSHSDISTHVDFPWQHPLTLDLPITLRSQLVHARCFSETMHGAVLLYNLMLAELADAEELVEIYREELFIWEESLDTSAGLLSAWDRSRFWAVVRRQNPRLSPITQQFANRWMDMALSHHSIVEFSRNGEARDLIRQRELRLKRSLARLTESARAGTMEWRGRH